MSAAASAEPAPQPGDAGTSALPRERGLALFYPAACLLSLLPFFWFEHPAVVDFANHAARLFLACQGSDPVVAAMYDYRFGIIPNLALDVINLPLCGLVPPTMVVKLTIASASIGIYVAGWLIQRKLHGRANAFLLLLPALSLNLVTTMGYVNYLVGIALAFFILLAMIGRTSNRLFLLLLGNVGGTLVFFSHVFAFFFLAVAAFGLLLQRLPKPPAELIEPAVLAGAMFLVPLALMPLVPSSGEPMTIDYGAKARLLVTLVQEPTLLLIVALILVVPLFGAIHERVLKVDPSLKMPVALLAFFVLLVPSGIRDAVDVDGRLLVPLAFLFFVALRPIRREPLVRTSVALVAGIFFAGQLWAAQTMWKPFDRDVAEFRSAVAMLPPGSALLSIGKVGGRLPGEVPIPYIHLASYATLDRRVFNPLEFTGRGMQPLSARQRFEAIDPPNAIPLEPALALKLKSPPPDLARRAEESPVRYALQWPERFDYVVHYHFGRPSNFDPATLTERHRGSFFTILEVRRPAARS